MNESNKAFQQFLYILIRDHIRSGTIHKILIEHAKTKDLEIVYSNPFLAKECKFLVQGILDYKTFREILEEHNEEN